MDASTHQQHPQKAVMDPEPIDPTDMLSDEESDRTKETPNEETEPQEQEDKYVQQS